MRTIRVRVGTLLRACVVLRVIEYLSDVSKYRDFYNRVVSRLWYIYGVHCASTVCADCVLHKTVTECFENVQCGQNMVISNCIFVGMVL